MVSSNVIKFFTGNSAKVLYIFKYCHFTVITAFSHFLILISDNYQRAKIKLKYLEDNSSC